MLYRTLGRTGIQVSPYALGAMMFGAMGNPDHDEAIRMVHRALDAGINLVDTADMYSHGESEEIVGKALQGRRDDVVLATKRGLAAALHSGDPAFDGLRAYFEDSAGPALRTLLDTAAAAGSVRAGVDPIDLLGAVSNLSVSSPGTEDAARAHRMVSLLVDGLRYGAGSR